MRILEVQPVFRAATRSPIDRTPKFSTARFPANYSASFSGHLGRLRRKPSPPRGRSRRSLCRLAILFANSSPFHRFPNLSPSFPARSSMDGFHLPPFRATSSMVAITTTAPRLCRSSAPTYQPSPPSLPLVASPVRGGRVLLGQARARRHSQSRGLQPSPSA